MVTRLLKPVVEYGCNNNGLVACWQDVPMLLQLTYTIRILRDLMYRSLDLIMHFFLKAPYLQDGWRLGVSSEVGGKGEEQIDEVMQQI